ncbi:MAG TPA: exopolysaccharide biosynthesis polyprenyl glycosylphosphotransferase [Vicinamibacterales bacterium]|jgi:exopolysaccharide biosynthesis polyprenyl glycosylphosphotransferase|nr:exopolysaccharide biosynthesis polyprenyl glycosylphosphotransferase [Vicinamibacterales bacterium]
MQPIVILGNGPMTSKLIEEVDASDLPYCVAGVVDQENPKVFCGAPWLGPLERLADIVERVRPARIVVAPADRRGHLPLRLLLESRMRGVVVEDALEFYEKLTGKIAIEALTPGSLILGKGFRHERVGHALARIISTVVSVVGLILAAPLLAAIALAIRIDSRGPVFFVQARAGRDDKPFNLLKFRTMRPSEDQPVSEWVQDNEGRITRVGKWLRRFRFDEVPQLVNVLRGEMNLIGPRPHPTRNQQIFMEHIAYYGLRSTVRPGVTGWAQIRYGYANNLEQETEKMRYDLYYIKNRTLWLDIRILFGTIFIMLTGHGAAEVRRHTRRVQAHAWHAAAAEAIAPLPAAYWPLLVRPDSAAASKPMVRQ